MLKYNPNDRYDWIKVKKCIEKIKMKRKITEKNMEIDNIQKDLENLKNSQKNGNKINEQYSENNIEIKNNHNKQEKNLHKICNICEEFHDYVPYCCFACSNSFCHKCLNALIKYRALKLELGYNILKCGTYHCSNLFVHDILKVFLSNETNEILQTYLGQTLPINQNNNQFNNNRPLMPKIISPQNINIMSFHYEDNRHQKNKSIRHLEKKIEKESETIIKCRSCNRQTKTNQIITLCCEHKYCKKCVTSFCEENIMNQKFNEIKCLVCKRDLDYEIIRANTRTEIFEEYDEFLLHKNIVVCQFCKHNNFFDENQGDTLYKCERCSRFLNRQNKNIRYFF